MAYVPTAASDQCTAEGVGLEGDSVRVGSVAAFSVNLKDADGKAARMNGGGEGAGGEGAGGEGGIGAGAGGGGGAGDIASIVTVRVRVVDCDGDDVEVEHSAGAGEDSGAGAGAGAQLPAPPAIELSAQDGGGSALQYQYTPTFAGNIEIAVTVFGRHVPNSPFPVHVRLIPPLPEGVHGKEVVWKGKRYAVLPEGGGPSAGSVAQDIDAHDIPVGARVVDVGDEDWAGILENVVKPYSWNTSVLVVRDKAKDTSPGYCAAGFETPGKEYSPNCTAITWSNCNRDGTGEHGTFQLTSTCYRVLIVYK
jgi:hypothetical protein